MTNPCSLLPGFSYLVGTYKFPSMVIASGAVLTAAYERLQKTSPVTATTPELLFQRVSSSPPPTRTSKLEFLFNCSSPRKGPFVGPPF